MFPKPSPLEAPLTRPAISTKVIAALIVLTDFEIVDILFNQFKLIDRINIKAKLRDIVKVEFSAEEKVLVNEAFAVETWEDVLAVCKKLVEYAKTEEKKDTPQPEPTLEDFAQKMMSSESAPQSNDDNGENDDTNTQETSGSDKEEGQSGSDENDSEESGQADSETQASEEDGNARKDEQSQSSSEKTDDAGKEQADDDGVAGSNDSETEEEKLKSITDTAQRQSEKELVERDKHDNPMDIVYGLTDQQWKESVVSFKELAEERKKLEGFFGGWRKEEENHFNSFESETKRFVQIMA